MTYHFYYCLQQGLSSYRGAQLHGICAPQAFKTPHSHTGLSVLPGTHCDSATFLALSFHPIHVAHSPAWFLPKWLLIKEASR